VTLLSGVVRRCSYSGLRVSQLTPNRSQSGIIGTEEEPPPVGVIQDLICGIQLTVSVDQAQVYESLNLVNLPSQSSREILHCGLILVLSRASPVCRSKRESRPLGLV
jgi:hypothetical protein